MKRFLIFIFLTICVYCITISPINSNSGSGGITDFGSEGNCIPIAYIDSIEGCSPVSFPSGISTNIANVDTIDFGLAPRPGRTPSDPPIRMVVITTVDTLYTATDTSTAGLLDTVWMGGVLFINQVVDSSYIKTNNGWDTISANNSDNIFDLGFNTNKFNITNGEFDCTKSNEFLCSNHTGDTFFVYKRETITCLIIDSIAIYATDMLWIPLFNRITTWDSIGSEGYIYYDTLKYIKSNGDTFLAIVDSSVVSSFGFSTNYFEYLHDNMYGDLLQHNTKSSRIAIGDSSTAENYRSISIGALAISQGDRSLSIGYNAFSYGSFSIGIGGYSQSGKYTGYLSSYGNVAIGSHAISVGNNAISLGSYSQSFAQNAITIGYNQQNEGANSTIIGGRDNFIDAISIESASFNCYGDTIWSPPRFTSIGENHRVPEEAESSCVSIGFGQRRIQLHAPIDSINLNNVWKKRWDPVEFNYTSLDSEAIFTEIDTVVATHSDSVCIDGHLYGFNENAGNSYNIKANTNNYQSYTVYTDWLLATNCNGSGSDVLNCFAIRNDCKSETFTIFAYTPAILNDTILIVKPTNSPSDCSPSDSALVYCNGTTFVPICGYSGAWELIDSSCYDYSSFVPNVIVDNEETLRIVTEPINSLRSLFEGVRVNANKDTVWLFYDGDSVLLKP